MSKVMIEVDTEEGTITASVNGKKVDNVGSVSIYKMTDHYSKNQKTEVDVCINSFTKDEAGVKTITSICAEKSETGRAAIVCGTVKAEYEDFVVNPFARENPTDEYSEAKASVKKVFSNIFGAHRTSKSE